MRSPGSTSAPSTVMPFGKHRGKNLPEIPADYFGWLLDNVRLGSGFKREIQAELDRRRRIDAEGEANADDELPFAPPRWVCGFWLNGVESALFGRACRSGELLITPDLPASSVLPHAWQAYCRAEGLPHRTRELIFTPDRKESR